MAKIGWKSNEQREAERRDAAVAALRARRDRELAATDYTQLPDTPLTDAERTAFRDYRQALRDLPAQAEGRSADAVEGMTLPDRPAAAGGRGAGRP